MQRLLEKLIEKYVNSGEGREKKADENAAAELREGAEGKGRDGSRDDDRCVVQRRKRMVVEGLEANKQSVVDDPVRKSAA